MCITLGSVWSFSSVIFPLFLGAVFLTYLHLRYERYAALIHALLTSSIPKVGYIYLRKGMAAVERLKISTSKVRRGGLLL